MLKAALSVEWAQELTPYSQRIKGFFERWPGAMKPVEASQAPMLKVLSVDLAQVEKRPDAMKPLEASQVQLPHSSMSL